MRKHAKSGQALVEMMLVTPLILMLLLSSFDLAIGFYQQQRLSSAASHTTSYAQVVTNQATGQNLTVADLKQVAMKSAGKMKPTVTICLADQCPAADDVEVHSNEVVTTTLEIPFNSFAPWLPLDHISVSDTAVTLPAFPPASTS